VCFTTLAGSAPVTFSAAGGPVVLVVDVAPGLTAPELGLGCAPTRDVVVVVPARAVVGEVGVFGLGGAVVGDGPDDVGVDAAVVGVVTVGSVTVVTVNVAGRYGAGTVASTVHTAFTVTAPAASDAIVRLALHMPFVTVACTVLDAGVVVMSTDSGAGNRPVHPEPLTTTVVPAGPDAGESATRSSTTASAVGASSIAWPAIAASRRTKPIR
jgi:hypothetical protein